MNMVKSDCELSVARAPINTTIAETIHYFKALSNTDANNFVKCAFSLDKGISWNTFINGQLEPLNITIPLKEFPLLTADECANWNNARDVIFQRGVLSSDLENIDFNNFGVSYHSIQFAYIITRGSISDLCELDILQWCFDSKGNMRKMKDTEYDVDVYEREVRVRSCINNDMIKVNLLV